MNIFALDINPVLAAREITNYKHIIKMPLESAQMLSTACRILNGSPGKMLISFGKDIGMWKTLDLVLPDENNSLQLIYLATHRNHPCNKWVRKSYANFIWLYDHSIELCNMYTERYGKVHASSFVIQMCKTLAKENWFAYNFLTPFYHKNNNFSSLSKSVENIREYYFTHKIGEN